MSKANVNPVWVRPRLYIGDNIAVGPGKIDLLRLIGETRSISAAARAMGMQYKKAWLLLDSMNQGFGRPLVVTATGGKGGGGATLTEAGQSLVDDYRAIEEAAHAAAAGRLSALAKRTKR